MSRLSMQVALIVLLGVLQVPAAPQMHDVKTLPEDIPTCKENEDVNECIRAASQLMIKRSINGVPELNIPPTDPITREKLSMQFQSNLVQGRVAVRNAKIVGLSKTVVDKVDYKRDGNTFTMKTEAHVPKLVADGQYKAEVYLNNNKMSAKGEFKVTLVDVVAKSEAEGELYERDGHTYVNLTSFNIDPTVGDMKIFATGLVPDPNLNAALLDVANQNWRQIYKTIIPETRSTWEPIILQNANEFFSHLPFDLLLTRE